MSVPIGEIYRFKNGAVIETFATLPAACINDAQIGSDAEIGETKLEHRQKAVFAQDDGSAASAQTRCVAIAYTAGTVLAVRAAAATAATGDSTVTIDVQKNGSSILSSTFQLDSGDAAYAKATGTISDSDLAAGDVLEVVITVSAGTGTLPEGVIVEIVFTENGS